eukprot:scaffold191295_cov31-Tisochrysis_lutea.AAC.1
MTDTLSGVSMCWCALDDGGAWSSNCSSYTSPTPPTAIAPATMRTRVEKGEGGKKEREGCGATSRAPQEKRSQRLSPTSSGRSAVLPSPIGHFPFAEAARGKSFTHSTTY